MKNFFLILLLIGALQSNAQMYLTKTGKITFTSKTPLETIEGVNKSVGSLLDIKSGRLEFIVQIKSFVFDRQLLQEHFNENYMESEKFPFATFIGKVNETIDYTKDGVYQVTMTGKLSMHGVEQERTIKGTITVSKGEIILDSKFEVKVADHKIKVPSLYIEKIAEIIQVTFHTEMTLKK